MCAYAGRKKHFFVCPSCLVALRRARCPLPSPPSRSQARTPHESQLLRSALDLRTSVRAGAASRPVRSAPLRPGAVPAARRLTPGPLQCNNGLVVQRDRAVEALARAGLLQCSLPPFPPLPLPAVEARTRTGFPQSSLPPFPLLPPRATPAEAADTISDTDSRVSGVGLPHARGRQMARARHQARAVTAPLRLRHPMRRCRRRRQVRRCPFNRCRSSSKLCDVRCHLSRDVCRQQTLGSTCVHAALTGWCRPPQPTRRRCMAQPVRWLQPSRPPHPCRLPT